MPPGPEAPPRGDVEPSRSLVWCNDGNRNDVDWAHEAARRGIGIALRPEYACRDDLRAGRLRRVLTAWSSGERTIYALYPGPRHLSRKVVAFVEMLSTGFQRAHALS